MRGFTGRHAEADAERLSTMYSCFALAEKDTGYRRVNRILRF
jgi:hypothetical protein